MTTNARDEKWSEWFTWHGAKKCPIDSECTVEFVTKGMGGGETSNPKGLMWVQAGTEADIIAYRYKIKEPETTFMHEDLYWLARNTRPKQFGQMSVRRNSDFHSGYQWSDLRQTGEGWYHHSKVEAARQQLGLDQPEVTPEEDEAWQAKERELNRPKYSAYFKDVRHIDTLDVYRVVSLFDCEKHGHPISHAAKKLLLSGSRTGGKDVEHDVREAIDTLHRWLEMREEDNRAV